MGNAKGVTFRSRRSSYLSGKSFSFSRIYLLIFSLYLVMGNVPRFIKLPNFGDNVLLSEVVIYGFAFVALLLHPRLLAFTVRHLLALVVLINLSFLYGVLINGFEVVALLYAVRLIAMLVTAVTAGYLLFQRFRLRLSDCLSYIIYIYLFVTIASAAIFAAFPDSSQLWALLEKSGINFMGDPHQRRLVSTYFDPNYFAVIITLPLLISSYLFRLTGKVRYVGYLMVFLFALLLTGSRSGIATALLLVLLILWQSLSYLFRNWRLRRSMLIIAPCALLLMLVTSPIYIGSLLTTWERLGRLDSDPSARSRFSSINLGFELFSQEPILGLGYNYLAIYAKDLRGLSSVDSSLQATLVNFGIIGTALILGMLVWWILQTYWRLRACTNQQADAHRFFSLFLAYVSLVILFTSLFNNVVYYQFWLIPTVTLGTYFSRLATHLYANNHH